MKFSHLLKQRKMTYYTTISMQSCFHDSLCAKGKNREVGNRPLFGGGYFWMAKIGMSFFLILPFLILHCFGP